MLALLLLLLGLCLLLFTLITRAVVEAVLESRSLEQAEGSLSTSTNDRAEALLRDLLDEHEYQQVTRYGYVDVASPSNAQRIYRIPRGWGLVNVYEGGRLIRQLCLQPAEPLPTDDVVALHKLMILGDEQRYLASANQYPRAAAGGPTSASRSATVRGQGHTDSLGPACGTRPDDPVPGVVS